MGKWETDMAGNDATTVIITYGTEPADHRQQIHDAFSVASRLHGHGWIAERPSVAHYTDIALERIDETISNGDLVKSFVPREPGVQGLCLIPQPSPDGVSWDTVGESLIDSVKADLKNVIIPSATDLAHADSPTRAARNFVEGGVTLHFVEEGITIRGGTAIDGPTRVAITALTSPGTPPSITQGGTGAYMHTGGRPPLGFAAADGQLVPVTDDEDHSGPAYRVVCDVLQDVDDGVMSKSEAARELGCVRATVGNALDRPGMYDLNSED